MPVHPVPSNRGAKATFQGRSLHRLVAGAFPPLALLLASTACRLPGQGPSIPPLPRVSAEAAAVRRVDVAELQGRLERVLQQAMRDSAFPGAIALVGSHDGILAQASVGRLDAADPTVPNERTLWDLASLTKVVGMTSGVMRLVQEGKIDLDAPVQRYLPEWTGRWKDQVTVRHLLTHSSGLPSWRPLYKEANSAAEAMQLVFATPLDTLPGVRMVYSDLGAILLGQIVTRVSGTSFDAYVTREVFRPLGMRETRWLPPRSLVKRIAPTEVDPWRQRHLRGEVHDENAFALGGISAHAGLFSTAADLSRLARMYLGHGRLDGVQVLDSATIERFTARPNSSLSHRALGWEKPSGSNSAGHRMSAAAFGHTGFTGTSFWVDPGNDIFVILLTNRVNPTRQNTKIGQVRVAVADAVLGTLEGCAEGATVLECPGGAR